MPPFDALAISVGRAAFSALIKEAYEKVKEHSSRVRADWANTRKINRLYEKIADIRKVKTIWQIDKSVDLMDFYCESHMVYEGSRIRVNKLSDLEVDENLIVEGIAGQGKSIFLRYLCSAELNKGEHIPVFVELRRINDGQCLKDRILAALEGFGFIEVKLLLETLATNGRLLLLLDAFDEIQDDIKARIITEIEDLVAKYPDLRIIITSRPYETIQNSTGFSVVKLDNLAGDEYKEVIKKLSTEEKQAKNLIAHIETQAPHIKDLLCTPLMVTLLVLSYKSYQQLPTRLSDFYDSLFQTLLQRHDGTKAGFKRKRQSSLDDTQCRKTFEAFCISTKLCGKQSFGRGDIYECASKAIANRDFDAKPNDFIDDIVRITCLLLKEGEEYRFVHKTVQEYYDASYIRGKPDPWVKDFYSNIISNVLDDGTWDQELQFLSEIDVYRHNKYYILPLILSVLRVTENDLNDEHKRDNILLDNINHKLSHLIIEHSTTNNLPSRFMCVVSGVPYFEMQIFNLIINKIRGTSIVSDMVAELESCQEKPALAESNLNQEKSKGVTSRIYFPALLKTSKGEYLRHIATTEYRNLFDRARHILASTKKEEETSIFQGLI